MLKIVSAFFILFSVFSYGKVYSEEYVANIFKQTALKYNIPFEVLYTIASIESDFQPIVITVETTRESAEVLEKLRSPNIRVIFGNNTTFHSKKSVISLYPKDIDIAKFLIVLLKKKKFVFDVGLMQINAVNFTVEEAEEMLDPVKNIDKAGKIYRYCVNLFKNRIHSVECYNRGAGNLRNDLKKGKRYYPYWDRFKRHYNNYFR